MITGVIICIAITLAATEISLIGNATWTIYPPLSGLEPDKTPVTTKNPAINLLTNFLTTIQIITLIMLLIVAFIWGKQKRGKVAEVGQDST